MAAFRRVVLLVVLLVGVASCASTAPVPDPMAGNYAATRFMVMRPGAATEDYLAAGAVFDVTIDASSATSGRFFVPAALTGDAAIEATLTGRLLRDLNGRLAFDFRPADLFVESFRFRTAGASFAADTVTADGTRIGLTLSRLSATGR